MNVIIKCLKLSPFHVLLLPLFFILTILNQYSGLLELKEAIPAFLKITAGLLLLCILLKFILKDLRKATTITTFLGIIFLFFGDIKQGFNSIEFLAFLSRYRFFIPLTLILSSFVIYKLLRTKFLFRATMFLNLLLIVYIIFEVWKLYSTKSSIAKNALLLNNDFVVKAQKTSGKENPDIYYLVLDCYPSGDFQKEMLGNNNDYFDNYLMEKGFYVVKKPLSNYNRTAFSIASTLNMEYLDWLDSSGRVTSFNYNKALKLINNASLFSILKTHKYEYNNLSIFDFNNTSSIRKENFLSLSPGNVIFFNTLWHVLRRDFLLKKKPASGNIYSDVKDTGGLRNKYEPLKDYNRLVLDSLFSLAGKKKDSRPEFLYAHLYMPHFPYFYDSSGNAIPTDSLYNDSLITDRSKFSGYIAYTNKMISGLLDSLISKGAGNSIIIIQSDHGIADFDFTRKDDAFRNYSAIYFPDRDYSLLHDSISNVNTFRIILNKYFNIKLPLLKDSTIYLKN